MSKPIVAIVGRPNVGKSTLFNYLSGERISIVDSTPGITRDRIYAESEWRGRTFSLIDTGGLEPRSDDPLLVQMQNQVQIAIKTADVILFMVDRTTGPTASDEDVADLLRRSGKPVLLVVNKVDQIGELPSDVYAFYSLGLGELYPISAEHRLGVGELLDALYAFFPPEDSEDEIHDRIRVAVIGKPNVGKSSLVNAMLGEQRLIVTDKPGTTRDAVDTDLDHELGRYTLIDTAGLRKKSRIDTAVEKYSMIRALAAIDRSDVCLIMIDATEGITEQDTKVAGFAHNKGKASIFVVNKWDLVEKTAGSAEK
nr:ribosome biogenesis GTPase Der [Clostridia bacterium]